MLPLLPLGLDETGSGKIAVKWNLVHSDGEMSWRVLHPDGSSLLEGMEKATHCSWQRVWRDVALGLTIAGGTVKLFFCEFFITELHLARWF